MITRIRQLNRRWMPFEPKSAIFQKFLKSLCQVLLGLFIYSFGVYLTIAANIGLAPWD